MDTIELNAALADILDKLSSQNVYKRSAGFRSLQELIERTKRIEPSSPAQASVFPALRLAEILIIQDRYSGKAIATLQAAKTILETEHFYVARRWPPEEE